VYFNFTEKIYSRNRKKNYNVNEILTICYLGNPAKKNYNVNEILTICYLGNPAARK
jgi:hypothetical protein